MTINNNQDTNNQNHNENHNANHNYSYDHDHNLEESEQPKTHQISYDISVHAVPVSEPISTHTQDLLSFRLRMSQNEITSASGALAGFLSGLVVCPLDVAKTRFQAQGAYLRDNNSNINLTNNIIPKYKGAFQSMNLIWKEEGIRGLYRGIVPITLGYFPTWMIYFTCYEHFKKMYSNLIVDENLSYFASAISSGAISSTVTNPIWVVKTRLMLQMDNGKNIYDSFSTANNNTTTTNTTANNTKIKRDWYKGTIDAFIKMYKNEGIGVFYKGLLPSYFGLCHVAIQFPLYENFKKLFKLNNNEKSPMNETSVTEKAVDFVKFILASSLSKMIASGITYPHELVRTRLQLFSNSNEILKESQFSGLIRVIKTIIKNEGFLGFYSGFVINLARTVPASAVTMVSFEYFREYFQRFSY